VVNDLKAIHFIWIDYIGGPIDVDRDPLGVRHIDFFTLSDRLDLPEANIQTD
jgi:hypothetical protein